MGRENDLFLRLSGKFLIDDGCWEWTAGKSPDGYGRFKIDGQHRGAHRVVYEMLVGPIPDGNDIDHLCRNRGCVRPDHLEAVTHAENVARGMTGKLNNANARKTHCRWGHPFDSANTCYTRTPSGGPRRMCRACRREGMRRQHAAA